MPNILGSAAGTIGFINALGLADGNALLTNTQELTAFTRVPECIDFSQYLPAPLAFTFAATPKLFTKMFIPGTSAYASNPGSNGVGYPHRLFSYYNDAGKIVFSIGFLPNGTKPDAFSTVDYIESHQLYVFFYNDASLLTPTSYEALPGFSEFPYTGKNTLGWEYLPLHSSLYVWYNYVAETPAASELVIEFRGLKVVIADVSTKIQTASKTLTSVKFGDASITKDSQPSTSYGQMPVSYIIVADGIDYSLRAEPRYPTAFTPNNQFTGAISAINTAIQDTIYVASSAEVASIFEVELADLTSYSSSDIIYGCSLYTFLRYVQSGGTSIDMIVSLVDATGAVYASAVVNVTANTSETYYNTRLAINSVASAITSNAYTLEQFNAMRVRIALA